MSAPDLAALYEDLEQPDATTGPTTSAALVAPPETQGQTKARVRGRPFLPGNVQRFSAGRSGNPTGRSRGIVKQVQRRCGRDFGRLVQALALIAWGKDDEVRAFFGRRIRVGTLQRLLAIEQLLDRGLGKPKVSVEDVTPDSPAGDHRARAMELLEKLASGPERLAAVVGAPRVACSRCRVVVRDGREPAVLVTCLACSNNNASKDAGGTTT